MNLLPQKLGRRTRPSALADGAGRSSWIRRAAPGAASILFLTGCVGDLGGMGGTPGSGGTGSCASCPTTCTSCAPGSNAQGIAWSTRFPRLSHKQWENTTRDLLHLSQASGLSASFTPDPKTRFDTNIEQNSIATGLRGDYETAAETLAKQVAQTPAQLAKILPAGMQGDAKTQGAVFATFFGRRAFRRPLTNDEVALFANLFAKGQQLLGGDMVASGVELTLRAMLQSPPFLYRIESSTTVKDNKVWLSGYEMASRLSYTLWNTMPTDEMFTAAAQGTFSTKEGVESWARQMLDDPRAQQTLVSFHEQLLQVANYGTVSKDPNLFPTFTADLQPILQDEAHRFIDDVVKSGGGIGALLTRPFTYVNNRTAPFYGLSGTFGSAMQRVDLDAQKRAGILTQLGFLSRNGGLVQSDPIHRGVLVNLNMLCVKIVAPNMIPPLPEQQPGQTNRERVEAHTTPCGNGCHDIRINPIGFAFEHYDAIGAWRDQDNGLPVNSAASYFLDGQTATFNDAVQLSQILSKSRQVHECYATNWLEYALGRPVVASAESAAVKLIADASTTGAAAKELLARITTLDAFRARPVEVAP